MPTQHPIRAGKVGFMGFKSQKLKEMWQRGSDTTGTEAWRGGDQTEASFLGPGVEAARPVGSPAKV